MALVLATNLTLTPDNQIATLDSVAGLVSNVEYSITGSHLVYDTRFIYRGLAEITLTRQPVGVLTQHTVVAVNVNTGPMPLVAPPRAIYPYSFRDQLGGGNLNNVFEFSPGPLPPQSTHGGAAKYKYWVDTSSSPAVLRMCVVPQASLTYVASEWTTLGKVPTSGGGFFINDGNLPSVGNASLNGNLAVSGNLEVFGTTDLIGPTATASLYSSNFTVDTGIKYQANDALNTVGFGMPSGKLAAYKNGTFLYNLLTENGGIISGTSPGYLQVVRNFPIPGPTTGVPVIWAVGADNENALVGCDAIGTSYPAFVLRRARGHGTPSLAPVQSGDQLGSLSFRGCTSPTTFSGERAAVTAFATETWTTGSQGANLLFWTTQTGGTNTINTMTLDGIGNLTIPRQLNAASVLVSPNPTLGTIQITRNTIPTPLPASGVAEIWAVGGDGEQPLIGVDAYGAQSPQLVLRHANGTGVARAVSNAGDFLGAVNFRGYNAFPDFGGNAVRILGVSTETYSNTANGSRLEIYTTPTGSAALATGLTLDGSGNLTVTGATATKPGGGAWVAPSDPLLKTDVHPYHTGLDAILALDPVTFKYNGRAGTPNDGRQYVGLEAVMTLDMFPSLVGEMEYRHVERDNDGDIVELGDVETYLTVDPSELTYTLINAVKELHARVQHLESKK